MNIRRWMARREGSWQQLAVLLHQAERRGLRSLSGEQVRQLASLYRSVSADLARARSEAGGESLVQELQQLTNRAYSQIYQGSRRQEWQSVWAFYSHGFPAVVRQSWAYLLGAAGLLIGGGLIGGWLAWYDPRFMGLVLGPDFVAQVNDSQELWTVSILGVEPVASSAIMVNNIAVSLRAIVGGVSMPWPGNVIPMPPGLFTIYLLGFNGVMLGAVGALVAQANLAYELWGFVFPHGALELPAIALAGAAGLLLARSILMPVPYRRIDALKIYGLQAAQLVYGLVPMLVIAGVIEGFISPQPWIANEIKYLLGTGIFVGFVQYCRRAGRGKGEE
ncbi:hypothetical protein XM38_045990 [Halomicronema hongdechloris C2206]|uniref:Stage II sporulation protein M n=1 Tax=Halomicronema hongdechloris C2206 TaxID=1641165 RepID=A0A1Z3HTI0_9CYAN|nr:stage II sporulation protein M [Halomicronema hongdechloris]ASC73628.1 hypothetical protein XM38_045990 [Halomicronema hongdechloris C2206]